MFQGYSISLKDSIDTLLHFIQYLQKAGENEFELSDMRKEKKDPASKIAIYAMVDLDNQYVYALKVGGLTRRRICRLLLLHLGCHNNSHLQCYWVLPSAE